MRRMPQMQSGRQQQKMTTTFMGYNHNEIIEDGEMYDMKNLSGDLYPMMTVRKKRAYTAFDNGDNDQKLSGISGGDKLTFVLGTKVYYNFEEVQGLTVSADPSMCPKQIVSFGACVLIWPDKVYFNTINAEDKGSMDRLWEKSGANVTLSMCRGDGTNYDMTQITVSATAPASPTNGQLWIDQSGANDVLRQYSSATQEWVEVATTYVKINATGIGTGLNVYDGITLSGIEAPAGTASRVKEQIEALNGSKIVYFGGTDYIVVVGLLSQTVSALKAQTVHADRKIPDLDYICESNNRLWGCRYGWTNGQVTNEIKASALGDFRNWERSLGNSQDSYTVSIGTEGPFTAAVTQKGYPVFFKENCIHMLYGNTPSSFQIQTVMYRGVQQGSWQSVQVVNERIFYKSRTDIMMFDGSVPTSVSEQLGKIVYTDARAGSVGAKYYISMKNAEGKWTLFSFDTDRNVWYREDDFHALGFGRVQDELFAIDTDRNRICSMLGNHTVTEQGFNWQAEEDFEWEAVFGIQGAEFGRGQYGSRIRYDTNGSRYMSRFDLRMYLEDGAKAKLEIEYNSDGVWTDQGEIRGSRTRTIMLPVVPKRCDHLRFRIRGKGEIRVYSICRMMEVGADGGTY